MKSSRNSHYRYSRNAGFFEAVKFLGNGRTIPIRFLQPFSVFAPLWGFLLPRKNYFSEVFFMKHNRKLLVAILLVVIIIACMLSFAGCKTKKYVQQTDTAVYFTVDKDIMADCTDKKLVDYMDALVDKGYLTYEVQSGTYPMLITVNGKTADASKNEYYFIYSDDAENTTETYESTEIDGKKYYSTNFGISDQPLKEGATYVFMISISTY